MAHNTCSGVNNNVFGPPQQTLFLGCSIASFSVNVGWNEQVGELTVQLAQDPCPVAPGGREKIYYDYLLNPQTTTDADPGFVYPNIGAPVYFRVGDFEWSGIVQSYEEQGSVGGKPLYTVKLIDPRQILEGTQLIVGEYAGNVYSTPNLINVYGYAESFGNPAPPNVIAGATFGSPAGAFGGSLSNDNGMPWNVAKNALQVLTSAIPPIVNNYSPYGRLVFRGGYGAFSGAAPSSTIGYGIIPEELPNTSMYLLDLSELPLVPQYWRLAGTSVSLMDAISQVCADAVCDYYIEFLPTNIGGTIYKLLKVRTASRAAVPVLGAIQDFIDNAAYPVSYSKGVEMRNEVTSALIVGGNVQSIYQAYNDNPAQGNSADIICPYFGLNSLGNVIEPWQVSGIWRFEVELDQLNSQMVLPLAINTAIITEFELLSALAGYDIWLIDGEEHGYDTVLALNNVENSFLGMGLGSLVEAYESQGRPVPPAIDLIHTSQESAVPFEAAVANNSQIVYDFISTLARTYYGEQFMIRLPYTTAKADPESQANNGLAVIKTTELPTDGGWTDESSVIGLPVNSIYTDFFSLPDNRLGCYVGAHVPGNLDVTGMDPNDYWVTQNQDTGETWVYARAQTQPDIVYVDRQTFFSPRVVISLSAPLLSTTPDDWVNGLPNHMAAFAVFFRNKSSAIKQYAKDIITQGAAAQSIWDEYPPRPNMIEAAAVPILSTVQTYGPWVSPLPAYGITKMERDDGLVPWEYGSTANMNAAGQTRALNDTASAMQYAEMGQITVPGYPVIPLGAELGAYDAGIFGGGFHLFETRTSTTATDDISGQAYNVVDGEQWTGLYGPNITSIGVEFGLGQVTTSYQMRTFTPSFGRFSKINAERMKKFGQQNLRSQKLFRLAQLNQSRLGAAGNRQKQLGKLSNVKSKKGRARKSDSPHEAIVGIEMSWVDGTRRSVVATEEASELAKELNADVTKKGIMSVDGLLRPFSLYGAGDLTRMALGTGDEGQYVSPVGPMPPMKIPNTGDYGASYIGDSYKLDIVTRYLNPFVTDPANMYGAGSGHDISIVGHGDGVTPQNLNIYAAGSGIPQYPEDCRPLALRGPLVIKGWGFGTDGKPIPNAADDPDNIRNFGQFTAENLQDTFADNWLQKSDLWPVGPVDLRFDRARGVWVSPPAHRLVIGLALTNISPYGSGYCQLIEGDVFDASGNLLTTSDTPCWCAPKFPVEDKIGKAIGVGAKIIAYYEPSRDVYWSLEQYGGATTAAPTTTTTTTTTTFNPSVMSGCDGQCKFVWSASTNQWNLDTSGCVRAGSSSSTTSSSTTSTAAPSTTTTYCNCPSTPAPAYTTSSTSTTTTTDTPTTPEPTCNCQYPTYCGRNDGDCTYTDCLSSEYTQTNLVNCTSTTAAPTGTTTTQTTATPTTTTEPPGCTECCTYECHPRTGNSWVLLSCDENESNTYDCNGFTYTCTQPGPTDPCSPGDCKTQTVCTVKTPRTPEGDCIACKGGCKWWWFPNTGGQSYYYYGWWGYFGCVSQDDGTWCNAGGDDTGWCAYGEYDSLCVTDCWGNHPGRRCGGIGSPVNCACPAPNGAPSDPCKPSFTKCKSGPSCPNTTTTLNPSTTTTSSTTTTGGPCTSGCIFRWNEGTEEWDNEENNCASHCQCYSPAFSGHGTCETFYMPCITGNSTTTSSSTTTSTTTTSTTTTTSSSTTTSTTTTSTAAPTTTTTACPAGYCSFVWNGVSWSPASSSCDTEEEGIACLDNEPVGAGSYIHELSCVECPNCPQPPATLEDKCVYLCNRSECGDGDYAWIIPDEFGNAILFAINGGCLWYNDCNTLYQAECSASPYPPYPYRFACDACPAEGPMANLVQVPCETPTSTTPPP